MKHLLVPREATFALWGLPGVVVGGTHIMGVYSWNLKSPKDPFWKEIKEALEIRSLVEHDKAMEALEVMKEWENMARRPRTVTPVAPGTGTVTSG